MKILGIETSCDETAASVVEDGFRLLSNVVQSQIDIHAHYGGVVPEIAARSHIEAITPVINQALTDAGCTWDDIDAIAVTYAPGLIGSLLVGSLAARTLAVLHDKPLYPIHHVEAHVYANFIIESNKSAPAGERAATLGGLLQPELHEASGPSMKPGVKPFTQSSDSLDGLKLPANQPSFPLLALIVSGGHSQLVLFRDHGDYTLIGQTQDDAVGEAFDKVAKILGLPYPGGPSITKAALSGDPHKYPLPKAKLRCTHEGVHTGMDRKAQASDGATPAILHGEKLAEPAAQRGARNVCHAYDFSFSGLKTAVLRAVQREVGKDFTFPSHELSGLLTTSQRNDFAASFQHTAIETLVDKAERAYRDFSPASVVIAGGVAANQELRRQLSERLPLAIEYAPIQLCTDNAAMIATLAYFYAQQHPPTDPYLLEVSPSLSMVAN